MFGSGRLFGRLANVVRLLAVRDLKVKVFKNVEKANAIPKPQRVGFLALKKGMTAIYDEWGVRTAVTVLQVLIFCLI